MIAAVLLAPLALAAQAAAEASPPAPARTLDEDRLVVCLDKARTDPTSAISEASQWLSEATGARDSYPQQCLGMAYTALLRWRAAEQAFLAARDVLPADAHFRRAQLGAMAGNAALAENRGAAALVALNAAARDAEAAGDDALQAVMQVDRARALVLQGDEAEAGAALEKARTLDPQSPYAFLLSATLARRQGKLAEAQGFIETAAALAPDYPEIGLEAGVIAMLDGREDAAKASWQSVLEVEPDGEAATTARGYLAQLDGPAAPASEAQ
jgi:tetratricopeptide (TPR) repeat protein